MTCHRPGTAWQNVCTRPPGSSAGFVVAAKTTPEVPIVALTRPAWTMPMPTAPAAWSPPPATTGVPARRPVCAAPSALTWPVTAGDSNGARQQRRGRCRAPRQSRSTSAGGSRRRAACPTRRRRRSRARRSAGSARSPSAAARVRTRAHASGSWRRTHSSFGNVKPVRAGLSASSISRAAPIVAVMASHSAPVR